MKSWLAVWEKEKLTFKDQEYQQKKTRPGERA
jgi:hypothetical protein